MIKINFKEKSSVEVIELLIKKLEEIWRQRNNE
jgi:hypothetical protein